MNIGYNALKKQRDYLKSLDLHQSEPLMNCAIETLDRLLDEFFVLRMVAECHDEHQNNFLFPAKLKMHKSCYDEIIFESIMFSICEANGFIATSVYEVENNNFFNKLKWHSYKVYDTDGIEIIP